MLDSERAAYGEPIVVTPSRQLVAEFGRGYSEKNLRHMVQFAEMGCPVGEQPKNSSSTSLAIVQQAVALLPHPLTEF